MCVDLQAFYPLLTICSMILLMLFVVIVIALLDLMPWETHGIIFSFGSLITVTSFLILAGLV